MRMGTEQAVTLKPEWQQVLQSWDKVETDREVCLARFHTGLIKNSAVSKPLYPIGDQALRNEYADRRNAICHKYGFGANREISPDAMAQGDRELAELDLEVAQRQMALEPDRFDI